MLFLVKLEIASQFIANLNLGIVYYDTMDYVNGLASFRQAYGYAIFLEDLEAQSLACDYLVLVSMETKDYSVAKMYLEKRLKIKQTLKDSASESIILLQLGELYLTWKGYSNEEALKYFKSCAELAETSRSEVMLLCYQHMAGIYNTLKDYESAMLYYKKALPLAESSQNQDAVQSCKFGMGVAEGNIRMNNVIKSRTRTMTI